MSPGQRRRLELDQRGASALHAALAETLGSGLLSGDRRDAARELFEQLEDKVPDWLSCAPVGGEAGYLIAAEAVLRALVDAEDRGRSALSEIELLRVLGDARPLGTTASDVLGRMRRERLIRVRSDKGEERWWIAAPAGRQFLYRDTAAHDDAWMITDADALLDLIYAEHRPGARAHRPCDQAIGRLADCDLAPLDVQLRACGLLDAAATSGRWLELTRQRAETARSRWREAAAAGGYRSGGPPPLPMPYRRELPVRINADDRLHPGSRWRPDRGEYDTELYVGCAGPPAAWLQQSSKTKLWATLRRDGSTYWGCRHCDSHWLVYLQAFGRDDQPAYRAAAEATHNRPCWCPTWKP